MQSVYIVQATKYITRSSREGTSGSGLSWYSKGILRVKEVVWEATSIGINEVITHSIILNLNTVPSPEKKDQQCARAFQLQS